MTEKFNPVLLELPPEIRGERVLLRPFRDGDAAALWDAVDTSRQHLKPWMPWVHDHDSPEFSREYIRKMHAKLTLREDFPMGIWRHSDGGLMGASGLHRIDWTIPAMEIGYWLRPDAEGAAPRTHDAQGRSSPSRGRLDRLAAAAPRCQTRRVADAACRRPRRSRARKPVRLRPRGWHQAARRRGTCARPR